MRSLIRNIVSNDRGVLKQRLQPHDPKKNNGLRLVSYEKAGTLCDDTFDVVVDNMMFDPDVMRSSAKRHSIHQPYINVSSMLSRNDSLLRGLWSLQDYRNFLPVLVGPRDENRTSLFRREQNPNSSTRIVTPCEGHMCALHICRTSCGRMDFWYEYDSNVNTAACGFDNCEPVFQMTPPEQPLLL